MFIHNIKYALKTTVKNKAMLIWTFIFPILLASFMFMAFGKLYENEEVFTEIPVAVVEKVSNEALVETLNALSEAGENRLLSVKYVEEDKAKEMLENEEVNAILYIDEENELVASGSSHENTVIRVVVEEFEKREAVIKDIMQTNPMAMEAVLDKITGDIDYFTTKTTSDGNQDPYTNYFYAIFAMSCLFSSFGAIEKIERLQANESALGMRRCLSATAKLNTVMAEFVVLLAIQFLIEVVTLGYLSVIGVNFGDKYPAIMGVLALGCCVGISFGIILGSFSKLSEGARVGIAIATSMTMSVMSDLCAAGVKDAIEHSMPIINRLNPAALIVDSFYALNVYDNYKRYGMNMTILGVMTLVLLTISVLILRRNKYASV